MTVSTSVLSRDVGKHVIRILMHDKDFVENLNNVLFEVLEEEWVSRDLEGPSPTDFCYHLSLLVSQKDAHTSSCGWTDVTDHDPDLEAYGLGD